MLRSFGYVTVAVAGTPVQCTVNETDPTKLAKVQYLTISAFASNSGANIYLGERTMNKTTGVGVYAIVPKGAVLPIGVQNSPDAIAVNDLYLDGDSNGDRALVSATEQ